MARLLYERPRFINTHSKQSKSKSKRVNKTTGGKYKKTKINKDWQPKSNHKHENQTTMKRSELIHKIANNGNVTRIGMSQKETILRTESGVHAVFMSLRNPEALVPSGGLEGALHVRMLHIIS